MRVFFTDTVGKQKTENKYTLYLVWEEQSTPKLIIRIFGHSGSGYCGCMNDHSMKIKVLDFVKRTEKTERGGFIIAKRKLSYKLLQQSHKYQEKK